MKSGSRGSAQTPTSGIIMPKIIPSRFAKSIKTRADGSQYIDYKSLERDRYAPWGRGEASGMK